MSGMNQVLEIDETNLTARVQPGVVTGELHAQLEARGLFYPPDPASAESSTVGGNVAENAGGLRAVKYGVTRDYVLALETVLATGKVIHTGRATMKNVTGYDLTRLLVGSEGTLGIFTEITLKLIPLPPVVGAVLFLFETAEAAAETTVALGRAGLMPRACEFMDKASLDAVAAYTHASLGAEAGAVLLVEVDGSAAAVAGELEIAKEVGAANGAFEDRTASDAEARDELWSVRRSISPALSTLSPGRVNEDVCLPRSELARYLARTRELAEEAGVPVANFGHMGDGNLHVNVLVPAEADEAAMEGVERLVTNLLESAVAMGGTLSGEHGIGTTKQPYLGLEIPPAEMALMRAVKKVFDPAGILNPGKIFPDD
jgi:glycolate oxidase